MPSYYDAMVALVCASLAILMVLTHENGRLLPEAKQRFYITYAVIILAAITEWLSVYLNGAPAWTRGLHAAVKAMDYIFTPIVGIVFIQQLSPQGDWKKFTLAVLAANTLLQVASLFTGWTFYIDEDNVYHPGSANWIFLVVYAVVVAYVVWQFYNYSKRYRKQNRASLYLVVLLAAAGMLVQEVTDGALMLSYISLTVGSILLFIHSNEFSQQTADDTISRQQALLETDVLTGMKSRYAFSEALNDMGDPAALPGDTVVFMIDLNGLKAVNDTHGHRAGDEMIAGVAGCVLETFCAYGTCYRTGGDEFVAIIRAGEGDIPELCQRLMRRVKAWSGEYTRSASLSYGYVRAGEYPGMSVEKLIGVADERMYARKARYYAQEGHDRRRR